MVRAVVFGGVEVRVPQFAPDEDGAGVDSGNVWRPMGEQKAPQCGEGEAVERGVGGAAKGAGILEDRGGGFLGTVAGGWAAAYGGEFEHVTF